MKKSKLIKNKCEVEECNITDPNLLEFHHHIPRTAENTTNNNFNLCILCCIHHKMIDSGRLKIIGIFPSTNPPNGRTVAYELDGKKNIDIDQPYVEFKPKSYKIFKEKQ
jgi:hypothetical protein